MGFFTDRKAAESAEPTPVVERETPREADPVLHIVNFDETPEKVEETENTAPAPVAAAAEEPAEVKEAEKPKAEPEFSDEMGIIAAGTVVHGHIKTKGHLAIAGVVEGSATCANLMLTGDVKGGIDCNNIVLDGCSCSSMLKVRGSLSIKQNTSVTGDIYCKHISVMGTINGNITAAGNVGLSKTAVIRGDIKAAVLAVEPGAKIEGKVIIG